MKNLSETIELMQSEDYKDRFRAEYCRLKIRYSKLAVMITKLEHGKLDFKPACPTYILRDQLYSMESYMRSLLARAEIEGIELGE